VVRQAFGGESDAILSGLGEVSVKVEIQHLRNIGRWSVERKAVANVEVIGENYMRTP